MHVNTGVAWLRGDIRLTLGRVWYCEEGFKSTLCTTLSGEGTTRSTTSTPSPNERRLSTRVITFVSICRGSNLNVADFKVLVFKVFKCFVPYLCAEPGKERSQQQQQGYDGMRTAVGLQGGEGARWCNLALQDVRSKFFDTATVFERRMFVDEG